MINRIHQRFVKCLDLTNYPLVLLGVADNGDIPHRTPLGESLHARARNRSLFLYLSTLPGVAGQRYGGHVGTVADAPNASDSSR